MRLNHAKRPNREPPFYAVVLVASYNLSSPRPLPSIAFWRLRMRVHVARISGASSHNSKVASRNWALVLLVAWLLTSSPIPVSAGNLRIRAFASARFERESPLSAVATRTEPYDEPNQSHDNHLLRLKQKLTFLRAGITTAELLFAANDTALRACRAREGRLRVAADDAHLTLRKLAIAAANNSAAYLSSARWRSPEGIMHRLDADLRPRALELIRRVIPERTEALRRTSIDCNSTEMLVARLRRVIDDWQLAYLRAEVDLLHTKLLAGAGDALLEALNGTLSHRAFSTDAVTSLQDTEPNPAKSMSHVEAGDNIDSRVESDAFSRLTFGGPPKDVAARVPDTRAREDTMDLARALRRRRTTLIFPGRVVPKPSPPGKLPSLNLRGRQTAAVATSSSSNSSVDVLLPSASCRGVKMCLSESLVFAADATQQFQRAAVATLALVALRAEGVLRARKAFLPLQIQRMIRGRRARQSSVAVAEFDGTSSPKEGAALPILCFYQDPILMSGCNKQGAFVLYSCFFMRGAHC